MFLKVLIATALLVSHAPNATKKPKKQFNCNYPTSSKDLMKNRNKLPNW